MSQVQTGIIILAAGKSSRLGQAKQLVEFNNKNLLQHTIDQLDELIDCVSVVVLGSNNLEIINKIDFKNSSKIINSEWEKGMSSSMQTGLKFLMLNYPYLQQVMLLLCDQPFVDGKLLKILLGEKEKTQKGIVCCSYADTVGVPAVFGKKYFDALLQLNVKEGAKKVILSNKEDLEEINFPKGAVDIDTPEDLENLKSGFSGS